MTTTTIETSVSPRDLAYMLGDDSVLLNARKLLSAKLRKQEIYRTPNGDTAHNGQPRANALFRCDDDVNEARKNIATAIDAAAERLLREREGMR